LAIDAIPPDDRRGGKLRGVLFLATDWATISSLVTGAGTLVLAIATFASVRSSNRSARIAEAALQEQRRPLLAPSRFDDPVQKIMFFEGHWVKAAGGRAAVEDVEGTVYLAISLRNVGSGIGVLQAWSIRPGTVAAARQMPTHAPLEEFRLQTRDLYIPAGDIGMWQGALRHPDDALRAAVAKAIDSGEGLLLELLYSDQVGGQRTITRFGLSPMKDSWLANVSRHWYLDWDGPRPESQVLAASERVWGERDAAENAAEALRENELAAAPDADATPAGDGVASAPAEARARD
jgi:hypothetical protein